jgi:hypothetical protein
VRRHPLGGTPFAFDNGAFGDWRRQRPFDTARYERACEVVSGLSHAPDFLVLPDIVGGGLASLEMSLSWLRRLKGLAPLYLAVQDGMTEEDVRHSCVGITGLFVGGTLRWKVATGGAWVHLAHELGMQCHVARVGTSPRVRWAKRIGADSIDSCLPLWSEGNLRRFLTALQDTPQMELLQWEATR